VSDPSPVVVWFRRDLRLDDHPALTTAVATGRPVIPLVVLDPALLSGSTMGGRRRARFEAAVVALDRDLREIGGRLIVRSGDPQVVLPALAAETGVREVIATRDVTPYALHRDRAVRDALSADALLRLLPGQLIVDPEAMGETRVFTPFHRRWAAVPHPEPLPAPARVSVPRGVSSEPLPTAGARGGPEALAALRAFAVDRAADYETLRNHLDVDGTSGFSADLHLGTLSARRTAADVPSTAFVRQLAWRDWAHHLLWFHRDIGGQRSYGAEAEIAWRRDPDAVAAWREGRTGYPLVDAGMRQLAATGMMHNRARMVAASFLVKHLLVDWRVGEAHFLRHLEDGDVANNLLGWRWTAGAGPDAAPFFRILNPVLQGQRFDPRGSWVRRWVPEVAGLPDTFVHRPWEATGGPPPGYPPPIVDHAFARARALAAFHDRPRP